MSSGKVTVTVGLDDFRTVDLIQELMLRLGDSLYDPEPKYDPYLNSLDKETRHNFLNALRKYY